MAVNTPLTRSEKSKKKRYIDEVAVDTEDERKNIKANLADILAGVSSSKASAAFGGSKKRKIAAEWEEEDGAEEGENDSPAVLAGLNSAVERIAVLEDQVVRLENFASFQDNYTSRVDEMEKKFKLLENGPVALEKKLTKELAGLKQVQDIDRDALKEAVRAEANLRFFKENGLRPFVDTQEQTKVMEAYIFKLVADFATKMLAHYLPKQTTFNDDGGDHVHAFGAGGAGGAGRAGGAGGTGDAGRAKAKADDGASGEDVDANMDDALGNSELDPDDDIVIPDSQAVEDEDDAEGEEAEDDEEL